MPIAGVALGYLFPVDLSHAGLAPRVLEANLNIGNHKMLDYAAASFKQQHRTTPTLRRRIIKCSKERETK